ncbi:type II toxin-antitoxin system HicA family toxin [Sebaldella sp. S0638]|uniref:type II toxin-antitoxin system HicA family toxin n=1 Tax=Sebaldella sp. S0638 TaxID=2957809 RepID=UPI00209ED8C4|nr:type II toxin-antitoxin system HicA family toxin [Sebaldella sp. S0638]MCP1224717.1 type II toxin-antitoxin system HicA family toxin [Sebaldella sp. S0638]
MAHDSKNLIQLLKKESWVLDRVRGSHHVFIKGERTIVIPHPRKDLKTGLYNAVLKQTGLK